MNAKVNLIRILTAIAATFTLVTASGCHTARSNSVRASENTGPNDGKSTKEMSVDPVDLEGSGIQIVYFDYDSAVLRADARESLKANAEKFRRMPRIIVQIAGHCDERGTQQYNLALGERRAIAAREYLVQLGIPAERLVTISYGSEQPADSGKDEAAWAKNRRCEFNRAM